MIALARVIKFALQNFRRNFGISMITASILALALVSVNLLLAVNVLTRTAVHAIESRVDVSVYFKPTVGEDIIKNIRSSLENMPEVRAVRYVSSDAALATFRERHADEQLVVGALSEIGQNPLGSALIIQAATAEQYPVIMRAIEQPAYQDYIDEKNFDDYRAVVGRINTIAGRVERFGFAISAVFALIALLIVTNSIRIAVYTRREEIGIMRLVGASSAFIRAPFLLEGLLWSVIAVAVTGVLVFVGAGAADPSIARFFEGTTFSLAGYFREHALFVFSAELIGTWALVLFAESLAMRRYLKV